MFVSSFSASFSASVLGPPFADELPLRGVWVRLRTPNSKLK